MRFNPFYDAWLFVTGNTDEHRASGIGWLLVALFLVLVAASIWIAWTNWRQDPAQRTAGHLGTWFMRVMIGVMFYQGSIWKLPFPVSGGFDGALRPEAQYAAFEFHRWIVQHVFIPLLPALDPITFFLELSFGVAFILGFLVRPMAVISILFVAQLWLGLYRQPEEWPWLYVFLMFTLGFFIVTNAGRSLGLDALLARSPLGPFKGDGSIARAYRTIA
jgi:uncharacterized membrane protein YphA (DoxX/SURF4 family)